MRSIKYFDLERISSQQEKFREENPFPHLIIDDFLDQKIASEVADEFPSLEDKRLFVYKNPLEHKLALNDWNAYPPHTYKLLQYLNSQEVVNAFSELVGTQLYADNGLHGGGWHMHEKGGKLNPHLDYSIHPKLGLQRRLNLIIYLPSTWDSDWGGDLGFWSHNEEKFGPEKLIREVSIKFNRAVLFDTTKNSWHGITKLLNCPTGYSRNSIAVYYLTEPEENAPPRSRALYAPTEDQKGDEEILELIKKRVDLEKSKTTYTDK